MYDFNVNEKLTAYQYLLKEKLAGDKNRELIALLKDLKLAGRQVSKELNTGALTGSLGDNTGSKNTQGEKVKKLDIIFDWFSWEMLPESKLFSFNIYKSSCKLVLDNNLVYICIKRGVKVLYNVCIIKYSININDYNWLGESFSNDSHILLFIWNDL